MVVRPPVLPVSRRPNPSAALRLGGSSSSKAAKTSAFPVLPAAAAALLLLGAAQLGFWWWQARLPGITDSKETRSNPFMAIFHVDDTPVSTGSLREAQRVSALPLPQNLQFGDAMAKVTVTIFTDPSCGRCREQVRAWTAGLPVKGVRQVYKFWPQDPERLTPGLLVELARQKGVVPAFWQSVQGAGAKDLDDQTLLGMLDRAGVPLSDQRTALVREGASLAISLEPDIKLAKNARFARPPVMMVDDYVLDGSVLNPDNLGKYVANRLDGRQILERNNLWLMQR